MNRAASTTPRSSGGDVSLPAIPAAAPDPQPAEVPHYAPARMGVFLLETAASLSDGAGGPFGDGKPGRAATLANHQRVREAAARGLTRPEIVAATGIGYDRVKQIIRDLGLSVAPATPGPRPKIEAARPLRRKAPATTERLCLCGCGRIFQSAHAGERIAPRCRDAWSER